MTCILLPYDLHLDLCEIPSASRNPTASSCNINLRSCFRFLSSAIFKASRALDIIIGKVPIKLPVRVMSDLKKCSDSKRQVLDRYMFCYRLLINYFQLICLGRRRDSNQIVLRQCR